MSGEDGSAPAGNGGGRPPARRFPGADFTRPQYWQARAGLKYYKRAVRYGRRFAPRAASALDVGSSHCEYINRLDWISRRERIDLQALAPLEGVVTHRGDFLTFEPPQPFDLVLCLQVLEHLERPAEFCAKLLAVGRVVVVSVPYRWPANWVPDHPQDPVDEEKLRSWMGRPPVTQRIVRDGTGPQGRRLVAVFRGEACSTWQAIGLRLRAFR